MGTIIKTVLGLFNFMSMLKWIAIIGALSVALGVVGSCAFKDKIKSVQTTHALKKNAKTSAKNIAKSQTQSDAIEARIAKGKAQADKAKAEARRIAKLKEQNHETTDVPAGDDRLDRGTVRVLDAARAGTPVESAGRSDEEVRTPSSVGVNDLVQNDLEVVRMYHELAERHDALVDFVQQKMREQAKSQ